MVLRSNFISPLISSSSLGFSLSWHTSFFQVLQLSRAILPNLGFLKAFSQGLHDDLALQTVIADCLCRCLGVVVADRVVAVCYSVKSYKEMEHVDDDSHGVCESQGTQDDEVSPSRRIEEVLRSKTDSSLE
ncbi:hypothetical protein Ccrd_006201 [Cynara cardunculus var. scolymus]|uniref:Uncharacterized protein n=1 Tax=Cynara cardunculus var. scolymus TaxID=59895 RepID=A0A118JUM5_CYNCS|nr:hypothetical protein Ccrd_006201 [Cynara cardunculus var. scolymus]